MSEGLIIAEERPRRVVVRADAREGRRELEAGLVERRIHLRRPLQVRDAVADASRAHSTSSCPSVASQRASTLPELGPARR